jgi:hypothetical protein
VSRTGECEARQYSDRMHCCRCGLTWDVNDFDPPLCKHVVAPRWWEVWRKPNPGYGDD